jgi:hypothetical protein
MVESYNKIACNLACVVNNDYEYRIFGITCHLKNSKEDNYKEIEETALLLDLLKYFKRVEYEEETEDFDSSHIVCNTELIKEKVKLL